MRILPLLFVLGALSLRPALAQVATKEAPSTPIRYSRAIPKSVLKLMPRGAKSLFWGTFSPKKGSGLMGVHLYDLSPSNRGVSRRHLGLDVFTSTYRKPINRAVIDFAPSTQGALTAPFTALDLYWLKRSQKKQPVLKIRCFDPQGFVGPAGDEVVVVFQAGWKGKAVSRSWPWGNSNAPNQLHQENVLQYDDRGSLQLDAQVSEAPDAGAPPAGTYGLFHWNGHNFITK
jgi:hypothetical protein